MSVYVDPIFTANGPNGWDKWCHCWADTLDELHAMADAIGMKREWFQDKPGFPHYDLVPKHRAMAVTLGAIETDRRAPVAWMREHTAKNA